MAPRDRRRPHARTARTVGQLVANVVEVTVGRVIREQAAVRHPDRRVPEAAARDREQRERTEDDADPHERAALRGHEASLDEAAEQREPDDQRADGSEAGCLTIGRGQRRR